MDIYEFAYNYHENDEAYQYFPGNLRLDELLNISTLIVLMIALA